MDALLPQIEEVPALTICRVVPDVEIIGVVAKRPIHELRIGTGVIARIDPSDTVRPFYRGATAALPPPSASTDDAPALGQLALTGAASNVLALRRGPPRWAIGIEFKARPPCSAFRTGWPGKPRPLHRTDQPFHGWATTSNGVPRGI